jgi:hypothetical protein
MVPAITEASQSPTRQKRNEYQVLQTSLLQTYRDDFGKYADRVKHKYLYKVFTTTPALVTKRYKYTLVDREVNSRELKEALNLLLKVAVSGKLRSLRLFMDEHHSKISIRISQNSLSLHDRILSIPIFAIERLSVLANEALNM